MSGEVDLEDPIFIVQVSTVFPVHDPPPNRPLGSGDYPSVSPKEPHRTSTSGSGCGRSLELSLKTQSSEEPSLLLSAEVSGSFQREHASQGREGASAPTLGEDSSDRHPHERKRLELVSVTDEAWGGGYYECVVQEGEVKVHRHLPLSLCP